jgi:ATP-dependent DNA helicase RecG
VPFLPHEFASRQAEFGLLDPCAIPVRGATPDDLDPVERQRLRRAIDRYGGDRSLLPLEDSEFDAALGFVRRDGDIRYPTLAGLLLLGREPAIRNHVPSHEVAFQVLEGADVRVNEFMRWPLLRVLERVEELFSARVTEREIQVGMFRVPVPSVDPRAFREAVANALTHRDYARLGAVHIRWEDDALTISNPGGFVEGVTLDNLIVVEPRPRNPTLADAFKRLGLVERTGRGVDLIYQGSLRYGRPAPDYSRTTTTTVVVRLSRAEPDLAFFELVVETERRTGAPLPVDALLALSLLREERRVEVDEVGRRIQRDSASARRVLERLVEAGLLERHGATRGRTYTLSAAVYRRLGMSGEYVRQTGFEPLQQEQMVLKYVTQHGSIRRREVAELCRISDDQAKRLLSRLVAEGYLTRSGERKGTVYGPGPKHTGAPKSDMGETADCPESSTPGPESAANGPPSLNEVPGSSPGSAQRPPTPRFLNRPDVPIAAREPEGGVAAVPRSLVTILPGPNGPEAG